MSPVAGRVAKAVLGVRPEDCTIVELEKGDLKGEIYANELIGDHTLVTIKDESDFIAVKAPKQFAGKQGERIGVALTPSRTFIFDGDSGLRLR